ncbi:MAG TPA: aminotransferase class I/II-fold pyridoxal phosphate-dependent enzyme [Candidatus Acidoferrum sp.]|nr:aminotransferase class I/II-fold pyridoxal phosphate-dependent enzyme [Candidatus Acidoferrum sp.]
MDDKYIAKRYRNLKPSAMAAASAISPRDDLINLTVGDPDINTDERIIKLAMEDALKGHTHYTTQRGDEELRAEIVRLYKEDYGMDIADGEIFVETAGNLAMFLALEATVDEGDEVLIIEPYYTPYPDQIEMVGGVAVGVPTSPENGFQVTPADIEAKLTPRTKAVIVNTPCNPTGVCMTIETLTGIADVAKKHDLLVIADDIYTAYCYHSKFTPIASLPGMRERTIIVNSFSKNYIMTGWRLGNLIAPPRMAQLFADINENVVFTAPSVSQRAGIYAIRLRKDIQKEAIGEFRRRVEYVAGRIKDIPGMDCMAPQGTFYVFADVRPSGLTSQQAVDALWKKAGVATLPGTAFGPSGEGFVRISCTVGMDKLKEAFDRIEKLPEFKA